MGVPMRAELERRARSADAAGVELRGSADERSFYGHAAVVNSRTSIGNPLSWGFFEEIAPGAFDETLASADARFLVDHDSSKLVARTSAGDLRLSVDAVGLVADADLDQELSYVRDLTRNLEKRRITGMSFGFMVKRDNWSTVEITTQDEKGADFTTQADLRTIEAVDLVEVSAVTFPAYDATDAALRAIRSCPAMLDKRAEMVRGADLNRKKIGRALDLMRELRAGKMLSQANMDLLQSVLDSLAAADQAIDPFVTALEAADDALDAAQEDLSSLLGVANPDASDPDEESAEASASGRSVPSAEYVRAFAARHGLSVR